MEDTRTKLENLIPKVLNNTDFEKIRNVMKFLDWKWAISSNTKEIPSIYELIECAKERLQNSIEEYMKHNRTMYVSSGGFKATCNGNSLLLEFVVEDWEEEIGQE